MEVTTVMESSSSPSIFLEVPGVWVVGYVVAGLRTDNVYVASGEKTVDSWSDELIVTMRMDSKSRGLIITRGRGESWGHISLIHC